MTKFRKRFISACLAGGIFLSGTGLLFRPAQTFVYAAGEEGTNSWVAYPRVSGWEYGGFGVANVFYALPEYGASVPFSFSFTKDGDESWSVKPVYAMANGNGGLTYFSSNSDAQNDRNGYSAEELVSNAGSFGIDFNTWALGDYTMTVTVPRSVYDGLEASVPFTVRQASNYWVQTPSILSWNSGKDYSLPSAEAKFGKTEYVIYSAKTNASGGYETGVSGAYVKDAVYYDSAKEINKLSEADEGIYLLDAKVEGTAEYKGLETTLVFRVFASEETYAALKAAQEAAIEEVEELARELGVTTNASDSIKAANTLKEVESVLAGARLQVYRAYAEQEIKFFAEGKVANYESVAANQLRDIRSANSIEEILTALDSARYVIEETYVHNTLAPAKKSDLEKYAQDMGALADGFSISTDNLVGPIDAASSETELRLALTAAKKAVASLAYAHGSSNLNHFRALAKEVIEQTAWYIGIDYKGDGSDDSTNVVVRYVEEATTGDKTEAQIKAVVSEALETEFVAILTTMQANLRASLEQTATRYAQQYSSVAAKLNEIVERARTDIYLPETFAQSEKVYAGFLSEIEGCVLEPAKAEAIKQIDDLLAETGLKSFDRDAAVEAINAAASIDEVEAILEAALNEIGSTLYETRAEKITELEAFAEQYYTDYGWRGILDAVAAGKSAINGAQKYSDILDGFEKAKLSVYKASVLAELDRYESVYGAYDVSAAIESARTELTRAHTLQDCEKVLADGEEAICAAAKIKAVAELASLNANYPSWDRSGAVNEINAAQTVAKVDEAYKKAEAELVALVNTRDNAINAARDMLTVYAESYGIENLEAVKNAITSLNTAQTAEDVPLLFDRAKLEIDRAAAAEQERVASVNTALIVLVVIFGFTAIGLGVAFALVLRRYLPKNKKGGKTQNPPQAEAPDASVRQEQPLQDQIQQNPFLREQFSEASPWEQSQADLPRNPPEN